MTLQFCIFKQLTGVPCPGCNRTRAFFSLLHGDVGRALWYNPLAIVLTVGAGDVYKIGERLVEEKE